VRSLHQRGPQITISFFTDVHLWLALTGVPALLLHTEKTGVPVYCVLPDMVVKALDAAPHSSARYFFWTGKSTVRSAKGKWQRRL
jgi:hypothetical protein